MNVPKAEEGEILYAVAAERFAPRGELTWVPMGVTYVHAKDQAMAKFKFLASEKGRRVRIVACAPAVGYHVDSRGENASAD